MKNLLLIVFLFAGVTVYAQDGVKVSGNTLTTRETPPVWPGCEDSTKSKKACFQEKIVQHLKENYKFPKDADGNIIRGKSVVSFIINKEGKPEITKVEGPREELNNEAKRIILSIPKMQPGKLAGKPTTVSYKVPFTF